MKRLQRSFQSQQNNSRRRSLPRCRDTGKVRAIDMFFLSLTRCTRNWPATARKLPRRGCLGVAESSAERPVSRILSCAVIPLGAALPRTLISDLPGGFGNCSSRLGASGRCAAQAWLLARASLPIWSCSVWGLPCPGPYGPGGALLPHHFTLTLALTQQAASGAPSTRKQRGSRGGFFSVALAVHGL